MFEFYRKLWYAKQITLHYCMSVLDLLASWMDKDLKNKWHILV